MPDAHSTTDASAEQDSLVADLALAHRLADAADAITLGRFLAADLSVATKPDQTPVTDADRAVERAIRRILAEHRPDDSVLGEEEGGAISGRTWVVDPIDGTKNFLRGVPVWATLVGMVEARSEGRRSCKSIRSIAMKAARSRSTIFFPLMASTL